MHHKFSLTSRKKTSRGVSIQNTLAARTLLPERRAVVQVEGELELNWVQLVPEKATNMHMHNFVCLRYSKIFRDLWQ